MYSTSNQTLLFLIPQLLCTGNLAVVSYKEQFIIYWNNFKQSQCHNLLWGLPEMPLPECTYVRNICCYGLKLQLPYKFAQDGNNVTKNLVMEWKTILLQLAFPSPLFFKREPGEHEANSQARVIQCI